MISSESTAPFLVTGATGNVGREVVRALRAQGAAVRCAVRHVPKDVEEPGRGGPLERVRFDFENPATFSAALGGVKRLFLMRPNPILGVKKTLNRFLDVAAAAGVEHVVFLSVAGAESNRRIPHHAVEQHLMKSGMTWTFLRAGFFAQNLTGPYREDIRAGLIVLPAGAGKVAYVDAQDLGDLAASVLLNPEIHVRQAYHLTGPDSLSFEEVAALLTSILGRSVRYHPASLWEFYRHCRRRGVGFLPTVAYSIIHAALRNGSGAATDPMLGRLLGRPRTLREFIESQRAALS
jgi:uncharacterized protein YbjT (DUF2867 family)